MKVYVVTSGCYSDYTIEKIFTDKQKAEEYAEWVWDANEVEEYDTEDDWTFNKYYKVVVSYTWYPYPSSNDEREPEFRIEKCLESNKYTSGVSYFDGTYMKLLSPYSTITIVRFVPAQNWNEEFYRNKYTKAIYDYVAIAKQKKLEGWSENDIRRLFDGYEEEV